MQSKRQNNQFDFQLIQINNKKFVQVPATLENVSYNCQIINNILKITLIQIFRSQSDNEYSETQYVFPIEDNICLESFQARYNEKTVKGIVKSIEDANKEYQDNKEKGNFVSYASYQKTTREDSIQIKLGNLPPNSQVEIVLTFSQQLNCFLNKYYVANIPIQQVKYNPQADIDKDILTLDLLCTGKITYAHCMRFPYEQIIVDDNTQRFILKQAQALQCQNFQLIFSYENMFDPQIILGSSKVYNEDQVKNSILTSRNSAMITFIPNFNEEITEEINDTIRAANKNGDNILSDEFQQKLNQELIDHLNSSRSEFIFLLDRSGSMSGRPLNKAIEALILFLKSLPNDSFFNVVSFGTHFTPLFQKSQKYTSETLQEAISKIQKFKATLGGTEIYLPLKDILEQQERIEGYNKQIFLLTDGEVQQPEIVVRLIKQNNKFNRVHTIGFGSGADKYLIQQSSIAGKGISQIIDLNSDLSEVIINILSSCITPTFDNFKIVYDDSIFESTYPLSTNFPCVYKDDIINIHLFFKPAVDIQSLTESQKLIKIEYYDSHKKQRVIKEIRLEMSDCFTSNPELQESVFKLGKQMYLNEVISSGNEENGVIQQALDFQLLTGKTAIICLIETLNDEQQIMYQSIQNNVTYSNIQDNLQRNRIISPISNIYTNLKKMCTKQATYSTNISSQCQQERSRKERSRSRSRSPQMKKKRQIQKSKALNQYDSYDVEEENNIIPYEEISKMSARYSDDLSLNTIRKSKQQQNNNSDSQTLKFENIINLVNNLGIWAYDESFINQYCTSLNSQAFNNIKSQFENNDAFMTLFVICILELFFSNEKPKWTLISKKSTSFIKKNIKVVSEFNSLKQALSQQINSQEI